MGTQSKAPAVIVVGRPFTNQAPTFWRLKRITARRVVVDRDPVAGKATAYVTNRHGNRYLTPANVAGYCDPDKVAAIATASDQGCRMINAAQTMAGKKAARDALNRTLAPLMRSEP